MTVQPYFLLIEDNPGDARLLTMLLAELSTPPVCEHVCTGSDALTYLRREKPYQQAIRPHLILLDLNLPGMSGCEILREIKTDPALRAIPVLIYSSSQSMADVQRCYSLHANAYLTKPHDLDDSLAVVRAIERFWIQTASLAK